MTFGAPLWLVLLPVFLLLTAALFAWGARRRRRTLAAAVNSPLLPQLLARLDPRRRRLRQALGLAGLALLALALARPQAGHQSLELERTGVDLLIGLDVSRSMRVADVERTNRLEAARTAIRHLLNSMGGDRVGLMAFAGDAFLVIPLTRDQAAVDRALDSLQTELVSAPGSNLEKAIRCAIESFDQASEGPRALLLVSDGEQLQGEALGAARAAVQRRVHVHTAGVGSHRGGRVPAAAGVAGYQKNPFGREVISRLDERLLRETAQAGRGLHVHLKGPNSRQLVTWFRQAAAGLPRVSERRQFGDPQEWFMIPLAGALALLLVEWLLTDRRNPARARTTLCLLAALAANTQAANDHPTPGAAPAAVTRTTTASGERPLLDPWSDYNRGVDAYAAGEFQRADEIWLDLLNHPLPRGLRQPVWLQIGNAEFRLGEPLEQNTPEQAVDSWRRSRDAYRSVLELNRRHPGARHNLELVERRLARLTHRLGNELSQNSESQPLDDAIDTLRAADAYLREAVELAPRDQEIARDAAAAHERLLRRLLERAQAFENRGDAEAAKNYRWADLQAEEAYRDALSDLTDARSQSAPEPSPEEDSSQQHALTPASPSEQAVRIAQERVEDKLSKLLTRMGQREQRSGDEAAAAQNAEEALGRFDEALQRYQEARELRPDNRDARRGEAQVRAAMEQLHVQEGQRSLERGIQATPNDIPRAAQELTAAVSHSEAALDLNPLNAEATALGEEARRRLPEVLTRLGQQQQRAGEQAESRSPAAALPHYEEAETSYRDALDLSPQHSPAQTGLTQVQDRLSQLRQQMQQAAQQAQQRAQNSRQPRRTLDELLGEVAEVERPPDRDSNRRRQDARRDNQSRRVYPDW